MALNVAGSLHVGCSREGLENARRETTGTILYKSVQLLSYAIALTHTTPRVLCSTIPCCRRHDLTAKLRRGSCQHHRSNIIETYIRISLLVKRNLKLLMRSFTSYHQLTPVTTNPKRLKDASKNQTTAVLNFNLPACGQFQIRMLISSHSKGKYYEPFLKEFRGRMKEKNR